MEFDSFHFRPPSGTPSHERGKDLIYHAPRLERNSNRKPIEFRSFVGLEKFPSA